MSNVKNIENIRKIVLKYKTALEKDKFAVKKIILYGSYTRGDFKPYSDIDICVISDKFSNNQKDIQETYLWRKVLEVDPRLEPVGYHSKDFNEIDPLVYEIKKEGIEIKSV